MKRFLLAVLAAAPVALLSYPTGQFVKSSGVPADGGTDCSSCHNSFGPAQTTGLTVQTASTTYSPGQAQTLRVTVSNAQTARWGFQLTARSVNDPAAMAGTFTPNSQIKVYCGDGKESPCGGNLEFASHTAQSAQTGTTTSQTWEVEWTPPANEVGPIILYATGVAANGDNLATGDRAFKTTVRLAATGACTLNRRPTIQRIVDGASFRPTLTANGFGTILGSDFQVPGRTRLAGAGDITDNGFPKQLGCIGVEVNGVAAPITYVQTDQLNFQVPSNLPASGDVSVRVIANPGAPSELRSDLATATVQSVSPAFFTFGGSSIAARNADFSIAADPTAIPGARAPKPGDIVLLYGTGFGLTSPAYTAGVLADPSVLARLRDQVSITIGGTTLAPADILYAGVTPGSISALYQFNVQIPATAPDGNVPVSATINGVSTQPGTTLYVKR